MEACGSFQKLPVWGFWKRWEAYGKRWEAYGKHEGGVGKRFFIMFNFSFGIIGTIWVLLGNFEIF